MKTNIVPLAIGCGLISSFAVAAPVENKHASAGQDTAGPVYTIVRARNGPLSPGKNDSLPGIKTSVHHKRQDEEIL